MSSNLRTKSTIESGGEGAQMYDKDGLPIYGMDLEIQKKLASKRDPYREAEAQDWIETVTGEKFKNDTFQGSLKDGILLCQLANAIRPKTVKKFSKAKMAFMQMNNIQHFLNACVKFGVPKGDCFVTIDLYEGKNIPAVVDTIFSLGSICMELKDFDGPTIGKKRAKKTKYEFSDEQLKKARNAPTKFSQGGKGCASQAGTRSISNEVVKTTNTGTRGTVSKMSEGGKGCSSQAGTRSISNEVVKTKNTGTRGTVSKFSEGGKGCSSQAGTTSISNEVVKVKKEKVKETTKDIDEEDDEVLEEDVEVEVVGGEEEDAETETDDDEEEEDTSLEELEKLAAARDAGEITEKEFAEKKKQILGL